MTVAKPAKPRFSYGLTKEVFAVVVSVISFAVSIVSFYTGSLKAPDLRFFTAPYIRHVVDEGSGNEAFFIPLTLANRGARQGTLVSVDLTVTYLPDGSQRRYYGQYFAVDNAQDLVGGYFTPIALNGYSSNSRTVCFYPLGAQTGNFFAAAGEYEFRINGASANVRGENGQAVSDAFRVTVDEAMRSAMRSQPDGEYLFPIPVERIP